MDPMISAVVCTRNRAPYLRKAIDSLLRQTLSDGDYEIIVVDNGSSDDTETMIGKEYGRAVNLHYLKEPAPGLSAARNAGWRHARGAYVAYLDDDAVASPRWLENILNVFDKVEPQPACVGGTVEPIWETPRPAWLSDRISSYLTILSLSSTPRLLARDEWLVGANMAFPRKVIAELGGFSTALGRKGNKLLSNEEIFLQAGVQALGYGRYYHPEISVAHHVLPERLKKLWFLRRTYWQGVSIALTQTRQESLSRAARRKIGMSAARAQLFSPSAFLTLTLPARDPDRFALKCALTEQLGYVSGLWGIAGRSRQAPPALNPGKPSLLFISPHYPFPPTEGGMIRTYSLVQALKTNWNVHFVFLHRSGQPAAELDSNGESPAVRGLTVEEYDRSARVNVNLIERLRANGRLPRLLALRDRLKGLAFMRGLFRIVNLPFDLYLVARRHGNFIAFLQRTLRSTAFDAVVLDYTKLAYLLPLVRNRTTLRILNVHNAESDLSRQIMASRTRGRARRAAWRDWRLYRLYEKYLVPRCDILLAATTADAEFHRRFAPDLKTLVFPNAVDTSSWRRLPSAERRDRLIFTGRMDYPPNAEAVEIFCRDILPRIAAVLPSTRLYIVGKNPPAAVRGLASPRVEVTGYVEDIIPFWRKASVLVVPLTMGGGTRIKILEAMALGRPVVSTTKGCEGLEVNHETHLLIADDPDAFAHSVVRLCRDPVLYANVARAARALVERKYSFGVLEDLFRDPSLFGARHSGIRGFREREPVAALDHNSALGKPDVSFERR